MEAGLIGMELLLRRPVREVVIVCPPSMLSQWQEEMENRFGLVFEILNRDYVERVRRERGFGSPAVARPGKQAAGHGFDSHRWLQISKSSLVKRSRAKKIK